MLHALDAWTHVGARERERMVQRQSERASEDGWATWFGRWPSLCVSLLSPDCLLPPLLLSALAWESRFSQMLLVMMMK